MRFAPNLRPNVGFLVGNVGWMSGFLKQPDIGFKNASSGEFVGDLGFSGEADRGIGGTYGMWNQRTAAVALS